jgi:hypothetical protein
MLRTRVLHQEAFLLCGVGPRSGTSTRSADGFLKPLMILKVPFSFFIR